MKYPVSHVDSSRSSAFITARWVGRTISRANRIRCELRKREKKRKGKEKERQTEKERNIYIYKRIHAVVTHAVAHTFFVTYTLVWMRGDNARTRMYGLARYRQHDTRECELGKWRESDEEMRRKEGREATEKKERKRKRGAFSSSRIHAAREGSQFSERNLPTKKRAGKKISPCIFLQRRRRRWRIFLDGCERT